MDNLEKRPIDRTPARLDWIQSLTGFVLAIFMWTHLFFVASILISKDAMYWVSGMMEAKFLTGWEHGYHEIVQVFAVGVFATIVIHALIAMRKFPNNWLQLKQMRQYLSTIQHTDTKMWWLQAVTGFVMFFFAAIHVYTMFAQADMIGPYASADRFYTGRMWPMYLILLLAVELHATIGMYRLAVKWGLSFGSDIRKTRKWLKFLKNFLTVFFIAIGLLSFAAYMKIGYEHRHQAGERFHQEVSTFIQEARLEKQESQA